MSTDTQVVQLFLSLDTTSLALKCSLAHCSGLEHKGLLLQLQQSTLSMQNFVPNHPNNMYPHIRSSLEWIRQMHPVLRFVWWEAKAKLTREKCSSHDWDICIADVISRSWFISLCTFACTSSSRLNSLIRCGIFMGVDTFKYSHMQPLWEFSSSLVINGECTNITPCGEETASEEFNLYLKRCTFLNGTDCIPGFLLYSMSVPVLILNFATLLHYAVSDSNNSIHLS